MFIVRAQTSDAQSASTEGMDEGKESWEEGASAVSGSAAFRKGVQTSGAPYGKLRCRRGRRQSPIKGR